LREKKLWHTAVGGLGLVVSVMVIVIIEPAGNVVPGKNSTRGDAGVKGTTAVVVDGVVDVAPVDGVLVVVLLADGFVDWKVCCSLVVGFVTVTMKLSTLLVGWVGLSLGKYKTVNSCGLSNVKVNDGCGFEKVTPGFVEFGLMSIGWLTVVSSDVTWLVGIFNGWVIPPSATQYFVVVVVGGNDVVVPGVVSVVPADDAVPVVDWGTVVVGTAGGAVAPGAVDDVPGVVVVTSTQASITTVT
jgi:hypothetical protein